ncbi:hypothetical protein PYCC9005_001495 [Savitreella phatthalungensis]
MLRPSVGRSVRCTLLLKPVRPRLVSCDKLPQHRYPGNIRNATTAADVWRSIPLFHRTLASGLIAIAAVGLGLGLYQYYTLPKSPYPESVTKHLRKALYYEGSGKDLKAAVTEFLAALEEATRLGLDQTSDDMTGLKIKIASVYEASNRPESALRIYAGLLNELQAALQPSLPVSERRRLLRRALGTAVRAGDIAMGLGNQHQAEKCYAWALESMLLEFGRTSPRSAETGVATGTRAGERWLEWSAEGGIYEAAANMYLHTGRPALAMPLYLKALDALAGELGSPEAVNAHSLTLLNSIASAVSEQGRANEELQIRALQWASKARSAALTVPVASDDFVGKAELDRARCIAAFNLAKISDALGRDTDARDYYKEAAFKAKVLVGKGDSGVAEVLHLATEAVQRLTANPTIELA